VKATSGKIQMTPSITIERHPYEEPHHVNLVIKATNGRLCGELGFYANATDLIGLADALERFPTCVPTWYLWELGSERPEDRFAHYMRFRVFTTDAVGHCAIQLRFNNNEDLPGREVSEFCIRVEPVALDRLSQLVREFAKLKHELLCWTPSRGKLHRTRQEAEPEDGV